MAFFHARPYLREDLIQDLAGVEDTTRVVQKFLLGRGQPQDVAAIRSTIQTWARIKERIALERNMELEEQVDIDKGAWSSIDALLHGMHNLGYLSDMIDQAIPGANNVDDASPGSPSADETGNGGDVDSKPPSILQATQGSVVVKHVIAPRLLQSPARYLCLLTEDVVSRRSYPDCIKLCRCCMGREKHWNGDCSMNTVGLFDASLSPNKTVTLCRCSFLDQIGRAHV